MEPDTAAGGKQSVLGSIDGDIETINSNVSDISGFITDINDMLFGAEPPSEIEKKVEVDQPSGNLRGLNHATTKLANKTNTIRGRILDLKKKLS